ncbi:MAG TPA: hypothetical protein VFB50_19890, partial [Chloroflexota bacterium]|nr:hypothetical protein [Chloroflexota bacterium]
MKLVKYDALRRALVAATRTDEVLKIKRQADKMAGYARIAKDKEAEAKFAELRYRAARALDKLVKQQRDTVGLAKPPSGKGQRKTDRR